MKKLINAFNPTIKTSQQKYQRTKSVTFSLNRGERFTKESILVHHGHQNPLQGDRNLSAHTLHLLPPSRYYSVTTETEAAQTNFEISQSQVEI